jgi:uncharacterized membrane protein (UPF0127 family)
MIRVVAALAYVLTLASSACTAPVVDGGDGRTKTTSSSSPASSKASSASSSSSSKVPNSASRGDVPPRFDLATGSAVVLTPQGERRFRVELAVKDEERQRGLMYRESLADDEGMVFFFERMQALSFWMKNTWIPLDMMFIDEDLRIVGIVENAEPLTTNSRKVKGDSRFVFEVRGGLTRELGIEPGQSVRFEGVPAALYQRATQDPTQ